MNVLERVKARLLRFTIQNVPIKLAVNNHSL